MNIIKIIILSFSVSILISCIESKTETSPFAQNSFRKFLALVAISNRLDALESEGMGLNEEIYHQDIIRLIDSSGIDKDINFYNTVLNQKAFAYYQLNKLEEAKKAVQRLALCGGKLAKMDSLQYPEMYNFVTKWHNVNYEKYQESLDITLLKKLSTMKYEDSVIQAVCREKHGYTARNPKFGACTFPTMLAHFNFWDSITQHKGNPKMLQIGVNGTLILNLINRHAGIINNERAYESIKKACESGEIPWTSLDIVESNYWRYETDKIRHLYFQENGDLDTEKSLFSLYAHSYLFYDIQLNGLGIPKEESFYSQVQDTIHRELFVVYFSGEKAEDIQKYVKSLHQIKDYMVSEQVNPAKISISETPVLVPKDSVGVYRVGYKTKQ